MKNIVLAAVFAAITVPAFAEPACKPGDALTPVWESIKAFEETGGKMIAFKINDGGCYEVYGSVGDKKFEVFFDPNTGAEMERIEG